MDVATLRLALEAGEREDLGGDLLHRVRIGHCHLDRLLRTGEHTTAARGTALVVDVGATVPDGNRAVTAGLEAGAATSAGVGNLMYKARHVVEERLHLAGRDLTVGLRDGAAAVTTETNTAHLPFVWRLEHEVVDLGPGDGRHKAGRDAAVEVLDGLFRRDEVREGRDEVLACVTKHDARDLVVEPLAVARLAANALVHDDPVVGLPDHRDGDFAGQMDVAGLDLYRGRQVEKVVGLGIFEEIFLALTKPGDLLLDCRLYHVESEPDCPRTLEDPVQELVFELDGTCVRFVEILYIDRGMGFSIYVFTMLCVHGKAPCSLKV